MITIMIIFAVLLILAFLTAVFMGVVAVLPAVLLIIALPLLDYFVYRMIFKRKKK